VFETDSVTNIAHQLGYFETIVGPGFFDDLHARVARVTADDVTRVAARWLAPSARTVGWFKPADGQS
jgi:zinc protease